MKYNTYLKKREERFALQKILFSVNILKYLENFDSIISKKLMSFDSDDYLKLYLSLPSQFRTVMEKYLDNYHPSTVIYLQNKLAKNRDEHSKLLANFLELYLFSKMR